MDHARRVHGGLYRGQLRHPLGSHRRDLLDHGAVLRPALPPGLFQKLPEHGLGVPQDRVVGGHVLVEVVLVVPDVDDDLTRGDRRGEDRGGEAAAFTWQQLNDALRTRVRHRDKRKKSPSMTIIDSQSIKTTRPEQTGGCSANPHTDPEREPGGTYSQSWQLGAWANTKLAK